MSDRSYISVSESTTACNSLALCGCTPVCFLTAINTGNILFDNTSARCITMGGITSGTAYNLNIYGESLCKTSGSANAGYISLCGGYASGSSTVCGGGVCLIGGDGRTKTANTDAEGGSIFLVGGCGCGIIPDISTTHGGHVFLCGGGATVLSGQSMGGNVYLYGGCVGSGCPSNYGGNLYLYGGQSISGLGGNVFIQGGTGAVSNGVVNIASSNIICMSGNIRFDASVARCISMGCTITTGTARDLTFLGESVCCVTGAATARGFCLCAGAATGSTNTTGGNIVLTAGVARTTTANYTTNGGNICLLGGCSCGVTPDFFVKGGNICIYGGGSVAISGCSTGGDICIKSGGVGGICTNSGGGNLTLCAGCATCGVGGTVSICAGQGDKAAGIAGGYLNMYAGASTIGSGGNVNLQAGASSSNSGGATTITAGQGTAGGVLYLCAGTSNSSAAGGTICINAGCSTSSGGGGDICIRPGTGGGATGRLYLKVLPAKTSETNVLYIDSVGRISSGATSGGGISWSGSTSNGVGTYVSSTCIKSNPNLIFDGSALCLTGRYYSCVSNFGLYTSPSNNHLAQNAYYDTSWKSYGSDATYGGAVLFQTSGGAAGAGSALKVLVDCSISTGGEALSFTCLLDVTMAGNINAMCGVINTPAAALLINSCTSTVSLTYANSTKLCTITNGICLPNTSCGCAVDWIASSDRRLKTDIVPISNALSMVIKLQGVCYHQCDDELCENRVGLIAQDVELILPEIVSHGLPSEEDWKYGICDDKLGLKYDKLTAVLIEAIKEQQLQIADLKFEVNNLKNKIL